MKRNTAEKRGIQIRPFLKKAGRGWKYWVGLILLVMCFRAGQEVIKEIRQDRLNKQVQKVAQAGILKAKNFSLEEREYFNGLFRKYSEIHSKYLTPDEYKAYFDLCAKLLNTGLTDDEMERANSYYEKVISSANQEERKTINEYEQYVAKLSGQRQ